MTRRVILQPEASAELAHAARWYEQQHADLGLHFLDAVDGLVRRIERWPPAAALVAELPEDLPVRSGRTFRSQRARTRTRKPRGSC